MAAPDKFFVGRIFLASSFAPSATASFVEVLFRLTRRNFCMAQKNFGIRRRDYSERHSHRKPETGRDVLSTEGAQGLQSGGRRTFLRSRLRRLRSAPY